MGRKRRRSKQLFDDLKEKRMLQTEIERTGSHSVWKMFVAGVGCNSAHWLLFLILAPLH
jgi:hypothetical protein